MRFTHGSQSMLLSDSTPGAENIDRAAYVRLAMNVVIRAVKDVGKVGGVSEMRQSYFQKTAREFLSDPSSERLNLWCAWLKVDSRKIQEVTNKLIQGDEHGEHAGLSLVD